MISRMSVLVTTSGMISPYPMLKGQQTLNKLLAEGWEIERDIHFNDKDCDDVALIVLRKFVAKSDTYHNDWID